MAQQRKTVPMSGSTTPNYNFNLPTIGGSQDSWGNALNANFTALDGIIHTLATGSGFLPLTGGVITGQLTVNQGLLAKQTIGVGISIAVGYPGVSDFQLVLGDANAGPNTRILQWATNVKTDYDPNFGSFAFWRQGTPLLTIDSAGNTTINGNGFKPGGGSWASSSDDRVKRNVRPYGAGLADICELLPIAFEYNGEGGTAADGITHYGLSAQKTREVMPELVFEMATPRLDGSIDPLLLPGQLGTQLGPLLLAACNAIRELAERVTALELTSA